MDSILYNAAMEGNTGKGDFLLADYLNSDEENEYQVACLYKSEIPRAIWNSPLTRRGSLQPERAARVGVSDSDRPHGTRPA
ncbi:hypothetical protein FXO38_20338 [Capsicum annuum]|nr:hypothetical protein FXO38_20338 [Capsicum annuum]